MHHFPSKLSKSQQKKLKQAQILLGDVQVEMLQADDKLPKELKTDNWRRLYRIRCELGEEIFRLNGNTNL